MYSKMDGENAGMLVCSNFNIIRRIQHPLIRKHIYGAAVEIYQPIMLPSQDARFQGGFMGLYSKFDSYIANNCLEPISAGKGKLFRQFSNQVDLVDDMKSPLHFDDYKDEIFSKPTWKITEQVLNFQIALDEKGEWRSDDKERAAPRI